MMNVFLSPLGGAGVQFLTNNGTPLSGGKLYTYAAGTTDVETTYTDNTGNTSHANPIVLDSAGRVPGGEIWLAVDTSYKFVLAAADESAVGTWDHISSSVNDAINANNADTVDDMHWSTGNVLTGIKDYIDGAITTLTNIVNGFKPVIASQYLTWTDTGFVRSKSCPGYIDLGAVTGTNFLLHCQANFTLATFTVASSVTLQIETADNSAFTGSSLLSVPMASLSHNDFGTNATYTLSSALKVVRDATVGSPNKVLRYVRLYITCSASDAEVTTVANTPAMLAVQLTV